MASPSPLLSNIAYASTATSDPPVIATTTATSSIADLIALKSFAAGLGATSTKRLEAIALCESGDTQFNSDGTPYRGIVNSSDVGIFQINLYYNPYNVVKGEGYDIYTIDGNVGYGIEMFIWHGSEPWGASKSCWSKNVPGWP